MPAAREQRLAGGEHTELLLTALGAVSAGERLEAILLRGEPIEDALAENEPVLLAALGLLSLRRRALRWLAVAADAGDGQGDAAPAAEQAPPPEILR